MKYKSSFFTIILISLCFTWVSNDIKAQNFDINLLRDINLNRNKNLDRSLILMTNSVTPLTLGTPVVLYGLGLLTKDSLSRHNGCAIGLGVLSTSLISTALKYSINRARPFETYPDLDNYRKEETPSFPSGHTSHAFALATSVSMSYPKWYIIAPSYLWATSIGYSRMHLGVHYPSDILMGAIVGAGSAYLGRKANQWLAKKNKKHRIRSHWFT